MTTAQEKIDDYKNKLKNNSNIKENEKAQINNLIANLENIINSQSIKDIIFNINELNNNLYKLIYEGCRNNGLSFSNGLVDSIILLCQLILSDEIQNKFSDCYDQIKNYSILTRLVFNNLPTGYDKKSITDLLMQSIKNVKEIFEALVKLEQPTAPVLDLKNVINAQESLSSEQKEKLNSILSGPSYCIKEENIAYPERIQKRKLESHIKKNINLESKDAYINLLSNIINEVKFSEYVNKCSEPVNNLINDISNYIEQADFKTDPKKLNIMKELSSDLQQYLSLSKEHNFSGFDISRRALYQTFQAFLDLFKIFLTDHKTLGKSGDILKRYIPIFVNDLQAYTLATDDAPKTLLKSVENYQEYNNNNNNNNKPVPLHPGNPFADKDDQEAEPQSDKQYSLNH